MKRVDITYLIFLNDKKWLFSIVIFFLVDETGRYYLFIFIWVTINLVDVKISQSASLTLN